MTQSAFKPKKPRTVDSDIPEHDTSYRTDVRLSLPDGWVIRGQDTSGTKVEARKKRDSFYEEFDALVGGKRYANQSASCWVRRWSMALSTRIVHVISLLAIATTVNTQLGCSRPVEKPEKVSAHEPDRLALAMSNAERLAHSFRAFVEGNGGRLPRAEEEDAWRSALAGEVIEGLWDTTRTGKPWVLNTRLHGVLPGEVENPGDYMLFWEPESTDGTRVACRLDFTVFTVSDRDWAALKSLIATQERPRPPKPPWPSGWLAVGDALALLGQDARSLVAMGEPESAGEVNKQGYLGSFVGWLDDHLIYRWQVAKGRIDNSSWGEDSGGSFSNAIALGDLSVGVDQKTKTIDYVEFSFKRGGLDSASQLSFADAARLMNVPETPHAVHFHGPDMFDQFGIVAVYNRGRQCVYFTTRKGEIYSSETRTDFETGKQTTTKSLLPNIALSQLAVAKLYVGPPRTRFTFGMRGRHDDIVDMYNLDLNKIAIPLR